MESTEKRREQLREAQRKFRAGSSARNREAQTKANLVTGLAASMRSAVRNGRDEFAPFLAETDAETVERLALHLAKIKKAKSTKRLRRQKWEVENE